MSRDNSSSGFLRGQIEYYRARATEYDDWFLRRRRYDRGEDATRRWFEQVQEVRAVLRELPLDGRSVLELAPGTGIWTDELVDRASRLTAVDAAREMLNLNRERLGERAARVAFVTADLFEWIPRHEFDAVVFCFWISHVPAGLLEDSLDRMAHSLVPGGLVFFLDSRQEHTSTAADYVLPSSDEETMTRRLDDGREFVIYKNFWDPDVLEAACRRAGLDVKVHHTADFFQFGVGSRAFE
ncbi:MAG TPA: class I SAM-dependent methyltransferase [Acidimicrobiales bacterium]